MANQCPKCHRPQADENELYKHLRNVHQLTPDEIKRLGIGGSGWHETPQNTPDGSKIALEHQEAALKAQMQKNRPLDIPMIVSPPPKQEIKLPNGWKEGVDGAYNFEMQTFEKHTPENIITKVARGHITANHGILTEYTYDKDTSILSEKQEEFGLSQADLKNYTVSDPEYVVLIQKIHNLDFEIKKIKKELKPEIYTDIKIEEYFRGEQGTEEHTKWKEDFMEKCVSAAARLQANNKMDVN